MNEEEDRHQAALRPQVERKLFLWLIVPIAVITFVNSIDRVNVSYAGAAMSAELGLSPNQFGQGVSMFFVAYLIFQYPHVRLLRAWGIKPWILVSMLLWGASGLWMARVESAAEFYAARFLLGMAEAGFAPGMTWLACGSDGCVGFAESLPAPSVDFCWASSAGAPAPSAVRRERLTREFRSTPSALAAA